MTSSSANLREYKNDAERRLVEELALAVWNGEPSPEKIHRAVRAAIEPWPTQREGREPGDGSV